MVLPLRFEPSAHRKELMAPAELPKFLLGHGAKDILYDRDIIGFAQGVKPLLQARRHHSAPNKEG
jgi:hypothetical protein